MRSILTLILSMSLSGLVNAAFHGDPPDANHPWAVHDTNRPQPPIVVPADVPGGAPSDAVVLFDGREASLANWKHQTPDDKRKGEWVVEDGALLCTPGAGYIATKEEFGDCQLHVEWMAPSKIEWSGQGRGNSGVFLMGMVEVQVLDNYNNPTYADGTAGAVYGVMPPAANPLRGPGQWQSYDIIFRRPIVRDGEVLDEGSMTVLVNGVVVQDGTPLEGGGGYIRRQPQNRVFPEKGSLSLQDHGNPVRYRNIWYRPLRSRALDGGLDGRLNETVTKEKRTSIAADLRTRAQSEDGLPQMLSLLESLVYELDDGVWAACDQRVVKHVDVLSALSMDELKERRQEVMQLYKALTYLQRHKLIDAEYAPQKQLHEIARAHEWVKK